MAGATVLSARWILPIDRPPIDGGWVEISGGEIVRLARGRAPAGARDLGDVALLPGLVNAHTHLELSWLAGRVRPAESMVGWIRSLIAARFAPDAPPEAERAAATAQAAETMRDTGTVLAGDVSNTLTTVPALHGAGLSAVLFHEILGFNRSAPRGGDGVDAGAAATAASSRRWSRTPHSWRPPFQRDRAATQTARCRSTRRVGRGNRVSPVSLGRSKTARGSRRWTDGWEPPGAIPSTTSIGSAISFQGCWRCTPCICRAGPSSACARGVRRRDLSAKQRVGGRRIPNVSRFYASGIPVAIGTDSLASAPTLNLFDELAELRRIAPDVAPGLCSTPRRAGAERRLWPASARSRPASGRPIAVDVPPSVTDIGRIPGQRGAGGGHSPRV